MLVAILLLFVREKSLDLTSRKLFFRALLSCMICISFDIASIVCIRLATDGEIPRIVALIVCKGYLITLVFQSYLGFLYASGESFARGSHKLLKILYLVWVVAGSAAIAALPIDYYIDGRAVYSLGLSTTATYIVVMILIISTIFMAFRSADLTSKRRRRAILIWQGTWLIAAALQFMYPELLLVGFAAAFGMVLIYAELENPHEGIDRMTGQYTANALMSYIGDRYQRMLPFAAMHIRCEYRTQSVDLDTEKTVMLRLSRFLNQDREAFVFRQTDNEFLIMYKTADRMQKAYGTLSKESERIVGIPVKLKYILIPESRILNTADEFFHFLHYVESIDDGRDCVTTSYETAKGMRRYSDVKEMIRTALEEKRVEVFYQPLYNVGKQKFTAAEALVRIRDLDGNIIPPGQFIPIAEENGLIVPLGKEILRQVCEFLYSGAAQRFGVDYIEVNMSVAQFDNENPAAFVRKVVEEYRIEPRWLNLEITETASNSAKQVILKNMNKLIEFGVHFSLDDFGTGRSNLDYFVDMPVDIIKFDYNFTQGYFKSNKAKYVMESVIKIMHKLGLSIVSEGVETQEQLNAMCSLGVNYIQGYYFSKPIPKGEFLKFLEKNNI